MALSQNDLDALDLAIASSELEVEVDGRKVRYRSINELMTARNHVATVIARGAGTRRAVYHFKFTTTRGD